MDTHTDRTDCFTWTTKVSGKHALRIRTLGRVDNGKDDGDDEHSQNDNNAADDACSLVASASASCIIHARAAAIE